MTQARVKDAAKRIARGQGADGIHTLSTGVRVQLHPVSSALVEELRLAIPMPKVPTIWLEAKEREEENPNDPSYLEGVARVERQRADAVYDALIMFGVELLDGLPEDDTWLRKLKFLEKHGPLNLSGYDLEDPFDLEFLYKRHVAVAGDDLQIIAGLHGIRPLEVARARSMFLGDQDGDADRGIRAEVEHQDGD